MYIKSELSKSMFVINQIYLFILFFLENTSVKKPLDYCNKNGPLAKETHSFMDPRAYSSSGSNSMQGIDLNQFPPVEDEVIDLNQLFVVEDEGIYLNQFPSVEDEGIDLNQVPSVNDNRFDLNQFP